MDLWIRSQDKEMLCKAECVEIMHDDPLYAKIYLNGKFPDLIVGCYEKQRALEILDEIQNFLTPRFIVSVNSDNDCIENLFDKSTCGKVFPNDKLEIKNINRDCWVYKMPQE